MSRIPSSKYQEHRIFSIATPCTWQRLRDWMAQSFMFQFRPQNYMVPQQQSRFVLIEFVKFQAVG
jgi:hypothetical protein